MTQNTESETVLIDPELHPAGTMLVCEARIVGLPPQLLRTRTVQRWTRSGLHVEMTDHEGQPTWFSRSMIVVHEVLRRPTVAPVVDELRARLETADAAINALARREGEPIDVTVQALHELLFVCSALLECAAAGTQR